MESNVSFRPLALVMHEMVTNAATHGALSSSEGQVHISWECHSEKALQLRWDELGGPAIPRTPENSGFGLTLIQTTVRGQLDGKLELNWRPQGLLCQFSIARSHLD